MPVPTFVRQATATTDSVAAASVTAAITTTTGNALVAAVAVRSATSVVVSSITDTAGNDWVFAGIGEVISGSSTRIELWYAMNTAAVTSVTVNLSGSVKHAVNVSEYANVADVFALDGTAIASGSAVTSLVSGAYTPTVDNVMAVAAINSSTAGGTRTLDTSTGFTALTDFASTGSSSCFGSAAYKLVAVPTATQAQWTCTSTVNYSGIVIGLSATAGSEPGDPAGSRSFALTEGTDTLRILYWGNGSIETANPAIERVLFMIHGTSNDADDYAAHAAAAVASAALTASTLVVAPLFADDTQVDATRPSRIYWGTGWRQGNKSQSTPHARPFELSSYEALDRMVAAAKSSFPDAEVIVAGFSAGGQLVTRYAAGTAHEITRFVVGAPSSYLYMDGRRWQTGGTFAALDSGQLAACPGYNDYKYGMAVLTATGYMNSVGAATLESRFGARTVEYLVGGDDDGTGGDVDGNCAANWQGTDRLDRMTKYLAALEVWYGTGIHARHKMQVVAGVAHTAVDVFDSPQGLVALFGRPAGGALVRSTDTATVTGRRASTGAATAQATATAIPVGARRSTGTAAVVDTATVSAVGVRVSSGAATAADTATVGVAGSRLSTWAVDVRDDVTAVWSGSRPSAGTFASVDTASVVWAGTAPAVDAASGQFAVVDTATVAGTGARASTATVTVADTVTFTPAGQRSSTGTATATDVTHVQWSSSLIRSGQFVAVETTTVDISGARGSAGTATAADTVTAEATGARPSTGTTATTDTTTVEWAGAAPGITVPAGQFVAVDTTTVDPVGARSSAGTCTATAAATVHAAGVRPSRGYCTAHTHAAVTWAGVAFTADPNATRLTIRDTGHTSVIRDRGHQATIRDTGHKVTVKGPSS